MNSPAVLILSPDAGDYLPYLNELAEAGVAITASESVPAAREAYAGQTVLLGQPDLIAELLCETPAVRWVQSSWAGVTPLLNTGRSNYLLTGVKDTFGPQMAEYVLGYMLAHELKVFERLGCQANRSWWDESSGTLQGKAVGIMGTGSIGKCIARRLKPFGMRITGFSREGAAAEGFDQVFSRSQAADFLSGPDYVVGVLPDTSSTRHILNAKAFKKMKNDCYLVNVGRGSLVDEPALVKALYAGELSGAVLDVFQQEPLPSDSPLWNAPNLVVTGHIAAKSCPEDIAGIFRENYQRYRAGEPLRYRIDFERGY